ncbi:hypothetical protein MHM93_14575 [Pseudoalteromonas sp. MM17-2]|uniref:hypothetical protein n=1 Tax=Pseudoalteromonas sp. MM17-2 TaxID=2917753 RepID=UPI001EF3FE93|nr:hypothetical protein [Pseudoalteromonas sp. MM17-2]MCG7545403.1 hypothetical protein [Pseudoalteromonas sp. MM17-2]
MVKLISHEANEHGRDVIREGDYELLISDSVEMREVGHGWMDTKMTLKNVKSGESIELTLTYDLWPDGCMDEPRISTINRKH